VAQAATTTERVDGKAGRYAVSFAVGILLIAITRVLNSIFDLYIGGRRRPAFLDVASTCPALLEFERRYPEIRAEADAILADRNGIPRYHDLDAIQRRISAIAQPDKRWQVFMLNSMGARWNLNCARCPVTAELAEHTPDLFHAQFSILEPGKSIPPHKGIYRGVVRYHLGIKTPLRNPPSMRVNDQIHVWREGESMIFDDTWDHEVYNDADEIRMVLIIDILRPMPPLPHRLNLMFRSLLQVLYGRVILSRNLRQIFN
jgi:aspartate beta-hydroxylase/beta-hydroxylase